MSDRIEDIRSDFSLLEDWEDRYRYIIELGQGLSPYPDEARDDDHKVPGCVSQVWLNTHVEHGQDPLMRFDGDSDAHIVRGLVAIVLAVFSQERASRILEIDAESVLRELGLDEHLSPQRANGLRSMVKRIKTEAAIAATAN